MTVSTRELLTNLPPRRLARVVARGVARGMMAAGPSRRLAERAVRLLGASKEGSLVHAILSPFYFALRGEVTADDLLAMVLALRSAGVGFWLAGGWGVDALAQRQTRKHSDVDFVIDDFARQASIARAALADLGFQQVRHLHYEVWMPERLLLRDRNLRLVDLLDIDWARLERALSPGKVGFATDELRRAAFTMGVVAGEPVPCLSLQVQLLYHSGFEARAVQLHDVALLLALQDGQLAEGHC